MKCPAKNKIVNKELCELFYPFGCGAKCKNLYNKWMKEEKEVQRLENSIENKSK